MASRRKQTQSDPSPELLRSLVLDYLHHNCYIRTASAFSRDSTVRHLDADGDEIIPSVEGSNDSGSLELHGTLLEQVQLRQEIRTRILQGRVDEATDLLNKHFPSVLCEPDSGIDASTISAPDTSYLPSTSIKPLHLSLNLRILAFTEACRTVPLEYPPKVESNVINPPGLPSMPLRVEEEGDDMSALLLKARKLYAFVNTLPDPDRTTYTQELEKVSGLLAFTVPETSSVSAYLSMERREAVADQINRAILMRTGQAATSLIELSARHTHVLWLLAHQSSIKCRPGPAYPPATRTPSTPSPDSGGEDVPVFDLHQFIELKS